MIHATLNDWIRHDSIPFSLDSPRILNASIDKVISLLDDTVQLLGFGEALHGGEEILMLRNHLFQRLVERHGYSAIAIESSFPRARVVNDYVAGRGPVSYEAIKEAGFSHGFGLLDANQELVKWMREYNSETSHDIKLQFYGFDSPTEMASSDSPSRLLHFVLDYLASINGEAIKARRERIDRLIGLDSDWENPEASFDPTKSVGGSLAAERLRLETEDLITELQIGRPELVAGSDAGRYLEAEHCAKAARQLLNYHAALARKSDPGERISRLLGIRDAMMADNLAYIVGREAGRGRVLAFAHNNHLQRGRTQWQFGTDIYTWWPVGSHLNLIFGHDYAVIGTALGVSDGNVIDRPEAGTLEARLTAASAPTRFIPTHRGQGLPAPEIAALRTRSGSMKNPTYFPLTAQSLTDFDWLAVLGKTAYSRGGPPLQ